MKQEKQKIKKPTFSIGLLKANRKHHLNNIRRLKKHLKSETSLKLSGFYMSLERDLKQHQRFLEDINYAVKKLSTP